MPRTRSMTAGRILLVASLCTACASPVSSLSIEETQALYREGRYTEIIDGHAQFDWSEGTDPRRVLGYLDALIAAGKSAEVGTFANDSSVGAFAEIYLLLAQGSIAIATERLALSGQNLTTWHSLAWLEYARFVGDVRPTELNLQRLQSLDIVEDWVHEWAIPRYQLSWYVSLAEYRAALEICYEYEEDSTFAPDCANLYIELNEFNRARETVSHISDPISAQITHASLLAAIDGADKAVLYLEKVLRETHARELKLAYAYHLLDSSRFGAEEEAANLAFASVVADPSDLVSLVIAANLFIDLGRHDLAHPTIMAILDGRGAPMELSLYRLLLAKIDRFHERDPSENLSAAMAMAPFDPSILWFAARVAREIGNADQEREMLNRLKQTTPNDIYVLVELARVNAALQNWDEVIAIADMFATSPRHKRPEVAEEMAGYRARARASMD